MLLSKSPDQPWQPRHWISCLCGQSRDRTFRVGATPVIRSSFSSRLPLGRTLELYRTFHRAPSLLLAAALHINSNGWAILCAGGISAQQVYEMSPLRLKMNSSSTWMPISLTRTLNESALISYSGLASLGYFQLSLLIT